MEGALLKYGVRRHVTRLTHKTTVLVRGIDPATNWALDRAEDRWFDTIVGEVQRAFPFVRTLYMPMPAKMNGVIAPRDTFQREKSCTPLALYGGIAADGVMLESSMACALTTGDCPVATILAANGDMVVCHVGRECVVQMARNEEGLYARQFHDVVANALSALGGVANVTGVHISCGIQTGYRFLKGDARSGEVNLALQNWLECYYAHDAVFNHAKEELNMVAFVRAHVVRLGVSCPIITDDEIDTFGDRNLFGNPEFASNARAVAQGRQGPKQRNLVIVARE